MKSNKNPTLCENDYLIDRPLDYNPSPVVEI